MEYICEQNIHLQSPPTHIVKVIFFIEFPLQQVELCQQLKEIMILATNFKSHIGTLREQNLYLEISDRALEVR